MCAGAHTNTAYGCESSRNTQQRQHETEANASIGFGWVEKYGLNFKFDLIEWNWVGFGFGPGFGVDWIRCIALIARLVFISFQP